MAISCDPSDLASAARCFASCISRGEQRSVRSYLTCQWANKGTLHPTALLWAARVIANGGAPVSSNTLTAVSNFASALDSAGLTSLMAVVNVFAPDSLIACFTPLIQTVAGNNPWTSANFTSNELSLKGLKGNKTNMFLNTGVTPGLFMAPSTAHGCVYVTSDDITSNQNEFGTADVGGANALRMYYHFSDTNTIICVYGAFNQSIISAGALTGYMCASRTTSTRLDCYYANSVNPHSSQFNTVVLETHTPSIVLPLILFGSNENTVFSNPSAKTISFASFGTGLTAAQSLALFNAVQTLRTAFGGGFT